jgi:multidrug efflux system outer membrane protein
MNRLPATPLRAIRTHYRRPGIAALGCLAVALSGCSLAPDYHRPASPVAQQYREPVTSSADGRMVTDIRWSDMFADQKLQRLIQLALDNNRDLRVAALNIEKARAQYRIQRAQLIPDVGVTATGTEQHQPRDMAMFDSTYSLGVGISSYELDLFGRVRSLKDQALQSYLSTVEARRAAHISLISEVATTYLTMAADLDLQKLAHDTRDNRQRSFDILTQRHAAGTASLLEVRQAEGELEDAKAAALASDNQVAMDRNALDLLVGAPVAGQFLPEKDTLTSIVRLRDIPAGIPSDLLHNRPDILAAEHDLMAANANIGAARAAFFPSISLTGGVGRASTELEDLFDNGNYTWSFTPRINLPIFTGGKLKANLEISKAGRDIAVARYDKTIQSAFREVSDALSQRSVMDGQFAARRRQTEAARASSDLVDVRYREKVAGYLEVLDAQRTLYASEQNLIRTKLTQEANLVTLYKVLGGGWSEQSPEQPSEQPNTPVEGYAR